MKRRERVARRQGMESCCYLLLYLCDCFAWIESLGAGLGAVHDGVAAIELEAVILM